MSSSAAHDLIMESYQVQILYAHPGTGSSSNTRIKHTHTHTEPSKQKITTDVQRYGRLTTTDGK